MTASSKWRAALAATAASAVLAAVPVLGAMPAFAQPYPPTAPDLTLGSTTLAQGDSLTFTGTGFGADEDGIESAVFSSKITLDFHTADENGTVTDTVTIPQHVSPGEHIFRLKGETRVHLVEITVLDGDPGDDDGGDPGHDDGGDPGHDDGGKPGHDDGGKPGHDDGGDPGHDDGGKPGHDDGGKPGHDDGGKPGHDDGGKPGHDNGGKPGHDNSGGSGHGGKPHLADTGEDRSAVLLGGVAGLLLLGGGAILLTRRVKRG